MKTEQLQTATLGGGCFWCTEAVFQNLKGVQKVISGYSGGTVPGHPTYREITSGLTGHAEVVQISFDANIISFKEILIIFMTTHNPTTLNQQGADYGTQYRSVIFYHNDAQKNIAQAVIKQVSPYYENKVVTQVVPFTKFYEAEKEHQNYYKNNPKMAYCSYVIAPKLLKLKQLYSDKLK